MSSSGIGVHLSQSRIFADSRIQSEESSRAGDQEHLLAHVSIHRHQRVVLNTVLSSLPNLPAMSSVVSMEGVFAVVVATGAVSSVLH